MKRYQQGRWLQAGLAGAVLLLSCNVAQAQKEGDGSFFDGLLGGIDVSVGGFVRVENAFQTGGENPNNQNGNTFNGVTVARMPGVPVPGSQALSFAVPNPLLADTTTRTGIDTSNNWSNYHILRGEVETGIRFTSDLSLIGRVRAIYDPGYDDFNAHSVDDDRGGIDGGDKALYRSSSPNYFEYRPEGKSHANPLEWAGQNYLVYFPSLFFDYNHGPLNLRVGNQQIAWGQAIFFRVFDVANGIDLRRHSVLDYAQEEYADKRVPQLSIRAGYQLTDEVLADAYVAKFQPTIYGNPNTQYNVIPVQFTVHDRYGDYDDKFSYGLRMKANYGQWGFQGMAVRRWNPDGVFRWTRSGVDKNVPSSNPLGLVVNTLNGGNSGAQLANTPFEASPGGVYSAEEWFSYAAAVRLDGVAGLNAAVNDFAPATTNVLASPVDTFAQAHNELDTFFIAAGGSLRGHIERKYFEENVFGLGVSYVTEAEPGSVFDQIIFNLETSYTPDRTFTSPDLGQNFLTQDASVTALVMEKYQRFSQSFPATYFVLQAMHRNADDLFGRSLKGYGGTRTSSPDGISSADYVVFAAQQPFPNDIYRAAIAVLYDPRGSILVQPGVKWKPRGSITIEAFYSYIEGGFAGNANKTLLSTVDFADEVTIRAAYQF
ncbi:MAG: hypothetical protein JWQ90_3741 [Hydrocarboniphaga sp.]|uniref:DUF1302 family protein n=1 Tax=Hydrocarboniphaga sp. TaxID=2033016 RepID=UPI00261DC031|nr:DUF1302 family protein [Hydrocarboniphaga sp.]MDB5971291.1 hypothetical protein [Hydrocarboniphaga sp.]